MSTNYKESRIKEYKQIIKKVKDIFYELDDSPEEIGRLKFLLGKALGFKGYQ